jgi:glycosyltransferase involved in cell wall biosynthesis
VLEASTELAPIDRLLARQSSGIEGQPAILWVGRLNANKAPLTVLDGFERCLRELPGAVLTMIYGTDDLLPSIARRLEEAPVLAEHVRLVGSVAHARMPIYYSAADLFVLGSHHEASGYALLEACACGLPPVVTDIPAFREITDGGSIGALWSTGDADSLTRALLRVARAESRSARQSVLERFNRALSWPAVGRAAVDAYARVHSAVIAGK